MNSSSKAVVEPFFLFGHSNPHKLSVHALSDHSFITPAGSKLCIRSQAKGGDAKFLPGLEGWKEVTCTAMTDSKTHLAVAVRGNLEAPPVQDPEADDDGDNNPVDAAIIIYKLPTMQHGDGKTSHKDVATNRPEIQGNTAIIEASTTVTPPKRVRVLPLQVSEGDGDSYISMTFSPDGKILYAQTTEPDHTLFAYDWSRTKTLGSLILEIEATHISCGLDPTKMRLCTTGPDHLCFWVVSPGGQEIKPLNPVSGLSETVNRAEVTDHAWLHDNRHVVCTTAAGAVVIVNDSTVVQSYKHAHGGRRIEAVLAFEEGVTGAATVGDDDDVAGFLTMGEGGLFCIFHHNAEGDNSISKTPYRISQRYQLISPISGPPNNNFMDVSSLSLGPDIGDACLMFCSTPSGVIAIDVGQLEAETDTGSFDIQNASNIDDIVVEEPSITSIDNETEGSSKKPMLSREKSLATVLDDPDVFPPVVPYKSFIYASNRHPSKITSMSLAARKPLLATCSRDPKDSSVRLWNYRTRELLLVEYYPGLQNPVSVSLHPSGNELLVSFDDNVKVYHLTSSVLKLSSVVQLKSMIHVHRRVEGRVEDKLIMNDDSASYVSYSPDGGMFAVVTGKFVQVFNTYGTEGGRPERVTVLNGHAQMITDLCWRGRRIHTTDSGGAVYEWRADEPARIREMLLARTNIAAVGLSLHEGVIIATGGGAREKKREQLEKKKKQEEKTLAAAGRTTMFNPQARQAIQKNRKKSLMMKKRSNALHKAKSIGKMNLLLKSASAEKITAAKAEKKSAATIATSTIMGWSDNISNNSRVVRTIEGRVSSIVCTKRDGRVRGVKNFAFILFATGIVNTFEWENVTGFVDPDNGNGDADEVQPHCTEASLHHGEIVRGIVSNDQNWLFTIGEDGCIVMSAITRHAPETLTVKQSVLNTIDEELALADINIVAEAKAKVMDVEEKRQEEKNHLHFKLKSMEAEKDKAYRVLKDEKESKIMLLEEEVVGLKKDIAYNTGKNANEILELEKNHDQKIVRIEAKYEKRISDDTARYMELKNAYDDLTVAAMDDRVNMDEFHNQEVTRLESEKNAIKDELEREIETLKEYTSYVKKRYDEVLENNDMLHDGEMIQVQQNNTKVEMDLKKKLTASHGETNMMQRQNKILRDTVENRNLMNYELKEELEKIKKKVKVMKEEEGKLMSELEKESSRANKWEASAGAQRRQVVELEKVRKVLTHQLHELRGMLEPKEHRIVGLKDKMKGLESEYEQVLHHASDLEKETGYKSKRIGSLSDTVRKQRNALGDKEGALQSVVTMVNLRCAEMMETGDWKEGVKSLKGLIAPYLNTSKSEAIRAGMEEQKDQSMHQTKLRRLLERKVERLEKRLRDFEEGGDPMGDKLKEENVELMEQLNEIRKKNDMQKKELLRLQNVLREKGCSTKTLSRSQSLTFQDPKSESQRSLEMMDRMLRATARENALLQARDDSRSQKISRTKPATPGLDRSMSKLSRASQKLNEAKNLERLVFYEQRCDNLQYNTQVQTKAIELLKDHISKLGGNVADIEGALSSLDINQVLNG